MTAPGTRGGMTTAQIAILAALVEEWAQREIAEAQARQAETAAARDKPEGAR